MYKKLTIEEIRNIAARHNGICLSDEYVNCNTKLKFQCDKKHIWNARPYAIKRGDWCPECARNIPLTINEMQKIATERNGKCLSNIYINNKTNILWECKRGHQWLARPDNVKNGSWCKKCIESNNEKLINNYLTVNNIKFEAQKTFPNCRGVKHKLPFDFFLSDYNIIVEYDGEQHFKPINFGGYSKNFPNLMDKRFADLKKRDEIKNNYCKLNNIKIIRISCYNKDIIDILDNELKYFK